MQCILLWPSKYMSAIRLKKNLNKWVDNHSVKLERLNFAHYKALVCQGKKTMHGKGLGSYLIISRLPICAIHAHLSTLNLKVCQE